MKYLPFLFLVLFSCSKQGEQESNLTERSNESLTNLTPEETAVSWIKSLGDRDFEYAFSLLDGKQWSKGLEWFQSSNAYGGINETKIFNYASLSNDGLNASVQINYFANDTLHGAGEYDQIIEMSKNSDGWTINRLRNLDNKLYEPVALSDLGAMKLIFGNSKSDKYSNNKIIAETDSFRYKLCGKIDMGRRSTIFFYKDELQNYLLGGAVLEWDGSQWRKINENFSLIWFWKDISIQPKTAYYEKSRDIFFLYDDYQSGQMVEFPAHYLTYIDTNLNIVKEYIKVDNPSELMFVKEEYPSKNVVSKIPTGDRFYYVQEFIQDNKIYRRYFNSDFVFFKGTILSMNRRLLEEGPMRNNERHGEWYINGKKVEYSFGRKVKKQVFGIKKTYISTNNKSIDLSKREKCNWCRIGYYDNGSCNMCGTVHPSIISSFNSSLNRNTSKYLECYAKETHSNYEYPYRCPYCGYIGKL